MTATESEMKGNAMNKDIHELSGAELDAVAGGFWQIALFGIAVAVAAALGEAAVEGKTGTGSGATYHSTPSSNVAKGTV